MSVLEKNVTSDWFMMSNILKIKSLQWFIDIALLKKRFKNKEFISIRFELNLLSQTDISEN